MACPVLESQHTLHLPSTVRAVTTDHVSTCTRHVVVVHLVEHSAAENVHSYRHEQAQALLREISRQYPRSRHNIIEKMFHFLQKDGHPHRDTGLEDALATAAKAMCHITFHTGELPLRFFVMVWRAQTSHQYTLSPQCERFVRSAQWDVSFLCREELSQSDRVVFAALLDGSEGSWMLPGFSTALNVLAGLGPPSAKVSLETASQAPAHSGQLSAKRPPCPPEETLPTPPPEPFSQQCTPPSTAVLSRPVSPALALPGSALALSSFSSLTSSPSIAVACPTPQSSAAPAAVPHVPPFRGKPAHRAKKTSKVRAPKRPPASRSTPAPMWPSRPRPRPQPEVIVISPSPSPTRPKQATPAAGPSRPTMAPGSFARSIYASAMPASSFMGRKTAVADPVVVAGSASAPAQGPGRGRKDAETSSLALTNDKGKGKENLVATVSVASTSAQVSWAAPAVPVAGKKGKAPPVVGSSKGRGKKRARDEVDGSTGEMPLPPKKKRAARRKVRKSSVMVEEEALAPVIPVPIEDDFLKAAFADDEDGAEDADLEAVAIPVPSEAPGMVNVLSEELEDDFLGAAFADDGDEVDADLEEIAIPIPTTEGREMASFHSGSREDANAYEGAATESNFLDDVFAGDETQAVYDSDYSSTDSDED